MFNPLNFWIYIWRNKRKIIPLSLILALSILGSTATAAITNSFLKDVRRQVSLYDSFNTIYFNESETHGLTRTQLNDQLASLENVDLIIEGNWRNIKGSTIFGNVPFLVYFVKQTDYADFMGAMKWQLMEGRLPTEGLNEIVLTERLMQNKGLKIGDFVGTEVDQKEYLRGKYQIVGKIRDNEHPGAMGNLDYINIPNNPQPITVYYIKGSGKDDRKLEQSLEDIQTKYPGIIVETRTSALQNNAKDFQSITQLTTIIMLIVTFVLSASIALLNYIFTIQRAKEFGILAALGYSKWFIIRKNTLENFVQVALAWLVGVGLTQIVYSAINQWIYNPVGIEGLNLFEVNTVLFSLSTPIMVFGFSTLTLYTYISKTDPITIIENRD